MTRSEQMREQATVLEIRAQVLEMIERNLNSVCMAYNDEKCEYELCEPNDPRLDDSDRIRVKTYSDIMDAILKMK